MAASTFIKWTVLVWLNAAVSFFFAYSGNSSLIYVAALVCGVFTFVVLYALVDLKLVADGALEIQQLMTWAAALKSLTQFFPVIEIGCGAVAIDIVTKLGIKHAFLEPYVTVLVDGVLLTLVVLGLMLLLRLVRQGIENLRAKRADPG